MKKKELFLVIIVIFIGITYNSIQNDRFNLFWFDGCSTNNRYLQDRNHPNDYGRPEIFQGNIAKVLIDDPAGNIIIEKAPEGETRVKIQPLVRVNNRDKREAYEMSQRVTITQKVDKTAQAGTGDTLRIGVETQGEFPYHRTRVNFKVIIPSNIQLDVITRYGFIDARNCGTAMNLESSYGDIYVENVATSARITNSYGSVSLISIDGDINLDVRYGKARVKDVKNLKFSCVHTRATIMGVKTETALSDANYSSIIIEDSNKVSIDGEHSRVELSNIKEGVRIKNSYEKIYLKNITGDVDIDVTDCRIEMEQIVADTVTVKNSYDKVFIDSLTARNAEVLLDNCKLKLDFDRIDDKLSIRNTYGNVTLQCPEGLNPAFDVNVEQGKIDNRTAMDIRVQSDENKDYARFTTTGKPQINIDNSYGDLVLETSFGSDLEKTAQAEAEKAQNQNNRKPEMIEKTQAEKNQKAEKTDQNAEKPIKK